MLFFLFLFESIPAGANHVSPLREQFIPTCRLSQPTILASSLHSWLCTAIPILSGRDLVKTAVGLHKHLEEGENMRYVAAFFLLFLLKETAASFTWRMKTKALMPSTIQQPTFQMHFPHRECRRHSNPPRLSPPPQRRGNQSLHAAFPRPNAAHDVQFTPIKGVWFKSPDSISIPLLVIAHSVVKLQQPLWARGKHAASISDRQAFSGSAAGAFANCAGAVDLL